MTAASTRAHENDRSVSTDAAAGSLERLVSCLGKGVRSTTSDAVCF
jgi:hypothetical protein